MVLPLKIFGALVAIALLASGCAQSPSAENAVLPKLNVKHIDTFAISLNPSVDKVLIRRESIEYSPDSVGTAHFVIDFYNTGKRIKSFTQSIAFGRELGSWNLWNDVFTDSINKVKDTRFLILSNGYEACGYPQNSYLFFADGNVEIVDSWVSMSDGGFGIWREFFPVFKNGRVEEFRHVTVSSEEVSGPVADAPLVEVSFRDSTLVSLRAGRWFREIITVPDIRYRTELYNEIEYFK